MNKGIVKILSLLLVICLLAGCTPAEGPTEPAAPQVIDYAASVKLVPDNGNKQEEVTVKQFIDGDTVHFHSKEIPGGVLKARFLAVNTPESTGKIEEFGKTAAAFTKEKLAAAESIIVESDTNKWDADSTGGRYLVWIWYKTKDASDYRNLNIELLQNGLAIASSSFNNRYGTTCAAAIDQAKAQKLNVYSGKPDPNFFYGLATEIDLKELRTNVASYNGAKVAVTGVITMHYNNGFYLEAQDPESGLYYGMYAYYGFNFGGMHLIKVGSEVRIAGNVSEFSGSWQISGMTYSDFIPTDDDVKQLSSGNEPAFVLTDAATFANGKVNVEMTDPETEEVTTKTFKYAELVQGTSVEMKNLYVKSVYTTKSDNDNSNGAMTLTCEVNGVTVDVRTIVLTDDNGDIITADAYRGKTIDVKGIVDCFDGDYQIKVMDDNYITVH
jgi:endonuclease YncB( thermonuclease family)/DNA/RNA endonuclease YhcR with UshA esterase domain